MVEKKEEVEEMELVKSGGGGGKTKWPSMKLVSGHNEHGDWKTTRLRGESEQKNFG